MDPQVAAHRLNEIALLLEVRGENPFKSRAFATAARTVQGLEDEDIAPLVRSKAIADLPGIGSTTFAVLADLVETGDSEYLDQLRETTPEGLVEMLRIPGLGPARIHRIHTGLGLETVADLEAAARDGRVASLSGFGEKTAAKILRGIAVLRETSGQLLHSVAAAEGNRLRRTIGKLVGVTRIEIAGSLRRTAEIVRDIDLVAGCSGAIPDVSTAVTRVPGVQEVIGGSGPSLTLRLINGVRADLHCVADASFPIALWRAIGSKEHCDLVIDRLRARGFAIREDRLLDAQGKVVADADEETLYRSAGLAWVPPELRENRGEVEAATDGTLPALIALEDLRGALHCHSNYSDGTTTILQMAQAAQARGWSYLGISDHSQSASYAGGLDRDAVLRQHDEIDRLNQDFDGFRVLKGIEADILADGTVDYADDLLDRFDYVIGSVHSRFSMGMTQMTERILKAMNDPRLTIVGHPTGRLLLAREPFSINMDAIMEFAAEQGVALELNCDPHRLDLDWRWLQIARKRGVTIEVGPDAHSPDGLSYLDFGICIARKGWLEAGDVLNTRGADDVLRFARSRREAGEVRAARNGS
ncbi:MAG TPA: DNA polymerase/3'-5' exonuclease PolX [Gemmatimonadaceae bacterium]